MNIEKPVLENEIDVKIVGTTTVENNINEVKEFALKLKDYYSKLIFTDEQIKEAESERATINKAIKKISDYRKETISEFKKPIELFEQTAKETEQILKETADYVDKQIKSYEEVQKEKRKVNAKKIYDANIEELKELIPFEKIFNEKWLNKGSWKDDNTSSLIQNEIIEIRDKVRNGLKTIESLNSEFELELKNTFLQDFSLENAILKNNQLIEQQKALLKSNEVKEEIKIKKTEEFISKKVENEDLEPTVTYTLKITGTMSQMKALRAFLETNEMDFEKVN